MLDALDERISGYGWVIVHDYLSQTLASVHHVVTGNLVLWTFVDFVLLGVRHCE